MSRRRNLLQLEDIKNVHGERGGKQGCQTVYLKTQKIPPRVYFGGPWNGKCWYILLPIGIIYGRFVYVMYVWPFVVLCGPLVYFSRFGLFVPRRNLATMKGSFDLKCILLGTGSVQS
jgi:hypothetical protein